MLLHGVSHEVVTGLAEEIETATTGQGGYAVHGCP
jgi:hypothetical protein